jgi:hypothetical protein
MKKLWLLLISLIGSPLFAEEFAYQAGVASQIITPTEPLWMAGYASRTKPCNTKKQDLWVKAIAIEDSKKQKLIVLTADICGIPRQLGVNVCSEITKQIGISRDQIMLTCTHTHSGPVVNHNLSDMYPLTPEQPERIIKYTEKLQQAMIDVCIKAVKELQPAQISIGEGKARFAVNRREVTPTGITNGKNPGGPVDHAVPTMKLTDAKGNLKAILFGYACHNTTLSGYEWSGDWAGYAQIELETKYPGTVALCWTGCGADANPLPRGNIELAEKYGKELATAVSDTLPKTFALTAPSTAKYHEIALPYDSIPAKGIWQADILNKQLAIRKRAEKYLKLIDAGTPIPKQYDYYPVQVWQFGDQLKWVSLGGEVVVDYVLRIKKEHGTKSPVWVTAYANDVLAYIPSKRVWTEGGYEGDSSMIYYGHPSRWSSEVESLIFAALSK